MNTRMVLGLLTVACLAMGCTESPVEPLSQTSSFQDTNVAPAAEPNIADVEYTHPVFGRDEVRFDFVSVVPGVEAVVQSSGTGYFTELGKATSQSVLIINLTNGLGQGETVWTVPNDDELYTESLRYPTLDPDVSLYEVTVVGGTGRFVNASGVIFGTVTVTSRDATGGTADGVWEGSITYPAPPHRRGGGVAQ